MSSRPVQKLKRRVEQLTAALESHREIGQEMYRQFERLDEALATPERIAADTAAVGGFVSGLNLTYTEGDVVDRAIARIRGVSK